MGTNYYAVKIKPTVAMDKEIHIGKSSAGWKFLFHSCEYFRSFPEVENFLRKNIDEDKKYVLLDEYDEPITVNEFLKLVEGKQNIENPDNFKYAYNINGYRFMNGEFC